MLASSPMRPLPLDDMHLRHWALPVPVSASHFQAATVCLSRHHAPPVVFNVENDAATEQAEVRWPPPDSRAADAWNNSIDTTEAGACACIIAGVEFARGYFAIRRAQTGTGADYYIGPAGSCQDDLENCYRLEVSGVDAGDERKVRQRVLQKVEQARRGNSNLPAIAGVVGFAARLIVLADVLEPA